MLGGGSQRGAICNIVPEKMVVKYGLKYDRNGDQGMKSLDAKWESISVPGACRFFVLPKGCQKRRMVPAIVSGLEGEPLLGWKKMKA